MNLGKVSKFNIIRETKLGYVLEKDYVEYFLHHNECNGKLLYPGDTVDAFLYLDKKNRVAATLFKPFIEANQIGFLKVMGVKQDIGVFCNIGISKDILLSRDDLPHSFKEWPIVDDLVLAELRVKNNHLILKPATKIQIIKKHSELYGDNYQKLTLNSIVSGRVYRITPDGINIVTDNYEIIFIFKTNFRKNYRLGEVVEAKIIDIHDDDYSGTINKNKEFQIQDDLKIIEEYLQANNGVCLITEKSSPELINHCFNMSKSAYKKAIGALLKQGKIEITDTKIILVDYKY